MLSVYNRTSYTLSEKQTTTIRLLARDPALTRDTVTLFHYLISDGRLPLLRRYITDVWASKIIGEQPFENRPQPVWYALYTRNHCEQLVCDQLAAKGFHMFFPRIDVWSQRVGQRRRISVPMFPGYLFCRHLIDKASYIEVRKARGLVRILGDRWDKPSVIPDDEIEAIRITMQASVPVMPHPYLTHGETGVLVPCGASEAFVDAAAKLVQAPRSINGCASRRVCTLARSLGRIRN